MPLVNFLKIRSVLSLSAYSVKTRMLCIIALLLAFSGSTFFWVARADNTAQTLPFTQNWTTTTLITANDNWSGVPGIEGFLGQDITTATGTDPQTLLTSSVVAGDLTVLANQSNTAITNGDVAEFDGITNPTIALQGSAAADAPYVLIHLNTTGQTSINVAYNLRDIDGSADNAIQPVALQYRVGNSGNFTNVPAGFVADATTGPSLATLVTPVSATLPAAANNQPLVQVRIITANAAGSDEWVGIDDISITAGGGGDVAPSVASTVPTNAATGVAAIANLTINFSEAVNVAGSWFAISGSSSGAHTAVVSGGPTSFTLNPDTDFTSGETVTVTIVAAQVTDQDVIDPPDAMAANYVFTFTIAAPVTLTPIHNIQGSGATSPLSGVVTTSGIVTGLKSNGFFLQEPDATVDADPLTSEGIFVFTSSAPTVAIGNLIQVTGTIQEFVPTQDPMQPPLTELGLTPTVSLISSGNPLPTPMVITATFPDPAGAFNQLERWEGMRVSMASMTVGGPTLGTVNEPNATATSNGSFYGTFTGVPRGLREPGVQQPDTVPTGSIPPIPRFDTNPEVISVDSNAQTGTAVIDVGAGAVVTNLVGPLDYGFRHYTILPDLATVPTVMGGPTPTSVTAALSDEFTVASYNLERFFDTVNDGNGAPILTATAFNNRLTKASLGIRNHLLSPDILGIVEMENLTTLQALATKINNDAVAASQPNPNYQAFLVEGNDVGGIDVGFLVKTAVVTGATPRVTVNAVVQELDGTLFVNPDASTAILNDRPPLRLDATVNFANGSTFPVQVIVNHMRSLSGATDTTPGSNGWATDGERIRAKRLAQAVDLANLVQTRQTNNPAERIVLVGDFNFFEFNDGYVDSMSTLLGTPVPDNQTVVAGDGVDLVNPDLAVLLDSALQRYSFVFDGNAQSLDHAIVNTALLNSTLARRVEHPRINADFPATARNLATVERVSDHDPLVAYFKVYAAPTIAKAFAPAAISAGSTSTVTVTLTNPNSLGVLASFTDTLTNMTAVGGGIGGTCGTLASIVLPADATNLSFSGIAVPANGSCQVSFAVRSIVNGVHSNTTSGVTISQISPAGAASNTATLTVTSPTMPTVVKAFSPATIVAGGTSTVTLTLSNTSGMGVIAAFTDTLTNMTAVGGPMGGTCATLSSINIPANATNLSFSGIVLPANGSCQVNFAVRSTVVGVQSNTTSGITTDQSAVAGPVSNTAMLTVNAPTMQTIAKVFNPSTIVSGGTSTVTLTLSNTLAFGVLASFTDTLANMTAVGGPIGSTCATLATITISANATNLSFSGIVIPGAGSCTVSFPVTSNSVGTWPNTTSGITTDQSPVAGPPSNTAMLTVSGAAQPTLASKAVRHDFDGDGQSDLARFDNTTGEWKVMFSSDKVLHRIALVEPNGKEEYLPAAADFDGDQRTDAAIYRTSDGVWFIRHSLSGELVKAQFGLPGDTPLPADFDGDGRADLTVWRAIESGLHIQRSNNLTEQAIYLGEVGDAPVIGDFNGDRQTDMAVFRARESRWLLRDTATGMLSDVSFGQVGDVPLASIVGDFDGDRKDDLMLWRQEEGIAYLRRSANQEVQALSGRRLQPGEHLVLGDYDGDGRADCLIWNATQAQWHTLLDSRSRTNN